MILYILSNLIDSMTLILWFYFPIYEKRSAKTKWLKVATEEALRKNAIAIDARS